MKHLFIAFALVLFTACSPEDAPKDFTAENEAEIQAYLTANNLTAEKSNSGLYYIIDNPGTGISPTVVDDRVKVAYTGYLTDGTIFDENTEGADFSPVGRLIRGFAEGLSYFSEGGSGTLIIPARLAYGSSGSGDIPGGSVIIFDIELIYVNYVTENDEQIQSYLLDNDITAVKSDSGLYYRIDEPGEGERPGLRDNVTVTYTGYLLKDGSVFDENTAGVDFDLERLIPGFAEGITYFKEGGKGTLYIPSHLAYGKSGAGSIQPGDVIIFDVELISVN